MRFSFLFVVIILFCVCLRPAIADDALAVGDNVDSSSLTNEQTREVPAVVEADRLEGKKGKQIEATGNAVLRKGDQTIHADRLLYFQDSQDIHAQGSVILIKGDQSIRADRLWYFRDNGDVDAQGSVLLRQKDSSMSGPQLRLNMDTSAGGMEKPSFVLGENNAHGSADSMKIQDKQHFTFDNASYTTCPADKQDWSLRMGGLEIDKSRQIGIAHHAWVEFMNVPILYSPWMDFPLNEQRKSGFLAPIFGGTANGGSELTLPYYWNIAPNLDATISPRFMAKRGLMVNNEIRYLGRRYQGEVELDVLPDDRLADSRRSFVSLKHNATLNSRLYADVTYNRVSDDAYFRDLANAVNATSQVNFLREGVLTYDADWGRATARVQRFQTLQDPVSPIISPYKRLPQLTLNTLKRYQAAKFSLYGEFVDFAHPTLPNGKRLVLKPGVSYALLNDPAFYITPALSLHSTEYVMGSNNPAALQDASRTLPILSIDSGVKFEREWQVFGNDYVQSLEPRAFYVYVPYKNQDALPNFDSAQPDFNFTQMFSENRFVGSDRIGDANQVTLAMSSRLLEQSNGRERLNVMLGERFSLSAPRVNLATPATTLNKSDVLLAASGRVTDAVALESEIQYDPNLNHIQRYSLETHYRPEPGKTLNVSYRLLRNTLRQIDISTQWPIYKRWHGVARWNYSLQDSRFLEEVAGLEYNEACWTLRLVAQRFATATQQANIGYFLQLELNDMVKMGSDPLNMLKQSVPGYEKFNNQPAN